MGLGVKIVEEVLAHRETRLDLAHHVAELCWRGMDLRTHVQGRPCAPLPFFYQVPRGSKALVHGDVDALINKSKLRV